MKKIVYLQIFDVMTFYTRILNSDVLIENLYTGNFFVSTLILTLYELLKKNW